MNTATENILVIKLSALGDFIQALGPMHAIRKHHPNAQITLLTTKAFQKFAAQCGYFNDIWIDEKPSWANPLKLLAFRNKLNSARFTRIYDLQNNDRTSLYFKLLKRPKPEWVGTAKGASHRNTSPKRTAGHAFDGHVQTLALAGITDIHIDRLAWMETDISQFDALKRPYALLVPGCAAAHPHKRWPAQYYAALAQDLIKAGIQPVLIGTQEDKIATDEIAATCPEALNLNSQTSLPQIATLARGASIAIGNDTGPMHLIAATGRPCISLFSGHTNPVKHAPKGDNITVLQEDNLDNMPPETVIATVHKLLDQN